MAKKATKAAKAKKAKGQKALALGWKKGDRVRVMRTAAEGWKVGTVQDASGGVAHTAKLDHTDEVVGLSGITWEAQP